MQAGFGTDESRAYASPERADVMQDRHNLMALPEEAQLCAGFTWKILYHYQLLRWDRTSPSDHVNFLHILLDLVA
jgi:hypothetical protein